MEYVKGGELFKKVEKVKLKENVARNNQELNKDDLKHSSSSKEFYNAFKIFYNAFKIIFSLSHGFDLRSLRQGREWLGRRRKGFVVRMEGERKGRKGRLAMTAEVFEVAPEVAVVEFSKSPGDTLEYVKLCEEEVRPSLNDIVWSWQGDGNNY
ncbi:hypothetical protein Ahy_A09g044954 [Arachis hypogaea]|uniref:Uncharacterized protein n=1 Tax=Arachis hypogaea TaxID=3818 RepID=A0A445BL60_ARAHY|nr:hypothetical protein Ahy_A09g044954 [Arachis hypogaea]